MSKFHFAGVIYISNSFYDRYVKTRIISENQLIKDFKDYFRIHYIAQKPKNLGEGIHKVEVKTIPNKSKKRGSRCLSLVAAVVEVVDEENNNCIANFYPEFLFPVQDEKTYNKLLRDKNFLRGIRKDAESNMTRIKKTEDITE